VPDPVIQIMVKPVDSKAQINMGKALGRFTREDPTFRTWVDPESAETIVAGMGELHLEVYIERMKREYQAEVTTGKPQVAYRETITQEVDYHYRHKKQTGGSGQFGEVEGRMIPWSEDDFLFESKIVGGVIPKEFIPSVEKGFKSQMDKGRLIGFPVVNIKFTLEDGGFHPVDSKDIAFQEAARGAFRETYARAKPVILEPIMRVQLEGPSEFQGAMVKTLMQRRGMITGTTEHDEFVQIDSDVPLAEMFGYSTDLRSATQGKAEFTMEFSKYAQVPREVSEELKKKYQEELAAKRK